MKAFKTSAVSMASKHILKTTEYSRTPLCYLRIKTQYSKKKLFIVTCARSWTAIMNTQKNLLEQLVKGLENTFTYIWPPTNIGLATTLDSFSIVGREGQGFARIIKESIFKWVNNLTLNMYIDKDNLPHIFGWVLYNPPELNIKNQ